MSATAFSKELREHCMRVGSIARVCKGTGINRQQFNKYLAGQMLPSARNMWKICDYLGVSVEHLMVDQATEPPGENFIFNSEIDFSAIRSSFGGLHAQGQSVQGVLQNGFYYNFLPVLGHPNLLEPWLVHFMNRPGGGQIQTCRNSFHNADTMGYTANHVRHGGPVVYGPSEASLIGSAQASRLLRGITFVNLQPMAGPDYFSTMFLTCRPDGPLVVSGVMKFLGAGCTVRSALAGLGIIGLDSPTLDPVIAQLMRAKPAAGTNWMQSITEKNLQAGPEGSDLPKFVSFRRLSA